MRSLTILAADIYQKMGKQYPNLTERYEATKKFILKEITQWSNKKTFTGNVITYKPVEFDGTSDSTAFQVRLVYDVDTKTCELKFGNLNAVTARDQFKWDDQDPFKMQKALFLHTVLEKEVVPILKSGDIEGIEFTPYDGDGLEDDRASYFHNMFTKLNKSNNFELIKTGVTWHITKKNESNSKV
jgi:hypothetical protein